MEILICIFIFLLLYLALTKDEYDPTIIPTQHRPKQKPGQVQQPTTNYILPKHHAGNMYMSAADKRTYLQSIQWKVKRKRVFIRDHNKCQLCNSEHNLECHHISYQHLGDEPLEHLTTLCQLCHSTLHTKLGYDRTTIFKIN